jgi:hypothetical protein
MFYALSKRKISPACRLTTFLVGMTIYYSGYGSRQKDANAETYPLDAKS